MKSNHTTANHRPTQGSAAFVRGCVMVTMQPIGMNLFDSSLDREYPTHPGEGSA
ncbi:MAG: hypothetical protein HEQ39_00135 [Rhizobacter sp.]